MSSADAATYLALQGVLALGAHLGLTILGPLLNCGIRAALSLYAGLQL
jgi:hypothetical protein